MRTLSVSAITGMLLAILAPAVAQTPLGTGFTYQGQLMDGGTPANGTYDLRFALFDKSSDGTQQGSTICMDNVAVADGLFTLELDFGAQFTGYERFLEIAVRRDTGLNCGDSTGFVTLSPRQPLTATPHALFALNAGMLDGLDSAEFLRSVPVPLTLNGKSAASHIIRGENVAKDNASIGIYGLASSSSGDTYGVYGRSSSTTGRGMFGHASATSGANYGVWAQSDSTTGIGVFGYATTEKGANYGGVFQSASGTGIGAFAYASAKSGANYGLWGQSDSTGGFGVFGEATAASGTTYGVYGRTASTDGRGVFGYASASTGNTHGGYFQSDSKSGIGVRGVTAATGDVTTYGGYFQSASAYGGAVYGLATDQGYRDTFGGRFECAGVNGIGVMGLATTTDPNGGATAGWFEATGGGNGVVGLATDAGASRTNYGGYFESASKYGRAVYGDATAASGPTYGGLFIAHSTGGIGAYGVASASEGSTIGLYGRSNSPDGDGVYGWADADSGRCNGVYGKSDGSNGRGVYGYAAAGASDATPYGVYGYCSTGTKGYGVYASGDMGASGTKSFRIDHPSDPENKYLLHYSAESPEVINFYRGTVLLDGAGEAAVELPPYFATINKSPSYQLTAVGAPMPNLHVAEEISEAALQTGAAVGPGDAPPPCVFRIAGGVAGGKVSWRVEAVRNDLRMRLHGAPVERAKLGPERGKYQHPEHRGLGPEMGMDYSLERTPSPAMPGSAEND